MLTTRGAQRLGQLVGLRPVHPALRGEEQDPVVGGADEEVPDDVVLLERRTLNALTAALLAAVQVGLGPLGVAGLGDRDDHLLAGDEVLVGHLALGPDDPGPPVVTVLVGDLGELVAHDAALTLRLGQDVLEVGDLGFDSGQLVDDLLLPGRSKPTQLHIEDGLGLDVIDLEQVDQTLAGDVDGLATAESTRSPRRGRREP